jgi:hypothetical protein
MSGFAAGQTPEGTNEFSADERRRSAGSPARRRWYSRPARRLTWESGLILDGSGIRVSTWLTGPRRSSRGELGASA